MNNEGLLLIISAPSGAGKTTLCRRMVQHFHDMKESISYTTRAPREGERDGVDYNFVSRERFEEMIAEDLFAEWALVHGNLYGTAVASLESARSSGVDILLDIDCQGAMKLKGRITGGVYIFIVPPSMEELRRRLESRSSDSREIIERRIIRAAEEIRECRWYDYIIINDDLETAFEELASTVLSERRKTSRMLDHVTKLFDI